jgi:hypothetical protein
MINDAPLLNVSGKASFGNYAALPGSGPACTVLFRMQPPGTSRIKVHLRQVPDIDGTYRQTDQPRQSSLPLFLAASRL